MGASQKILLWLCLRERCYFVADQPPPLPPWEATRGIAKSASKATVHRLVIWAYVIRHGISARRDVVGLPWQCQWQVFPPQVRGEHTFPGPATRGSADPSVCRS